MSWPFTAVVLDVDGLNPSRGLSTDCPPRAVLDAWNHRQARP